MPVNKTRLTMNVYQANGDPAAGWRYKFQLGRWGTDGSYHYTDDPVYFTVDDTGTLVVDLFPSSVTAEGTVYLWTKIPPNTVDPYWPSGWLDVPDSNFEVNLAPLLVGTDLPESTQANALTQCLAAVGAAEAYSVATAADADRAEAAWINAAVGTPYGFNTAPDLLANTSLSYTPGAGKIVVTAGQYLLAGGFRYQVAASGASDHHVTTAGGVKLYFSAGHGASRYDIGVPLMQLGAIRNNGDQSDAYKFWRLIEDSSHKPIGFRNSAGAGLEIETTDSVIRVHHNIGGDYVGGLIASLDETLAQTGIRLGCSVGLTYSDIWLYRDFMANVNRSSGGVWQHDPNNAEPFSAAWNASGYLDITFPNTPNAIGIVQQIGSVEIREWSAQFQQISATSARIHFFHSKPKKHTARIRWSSGFSVLTGSKNITVGTFSGGLLPVSFTNGDVNDFDIQVTAGGGLNGIGYQCQIRNPSATGFDLQWVNSAGAVVTVADNKMEAFVSAISGSQAEQPSPSTSFAVRVLSRSNINPKSISSTDYPAGNIWLVGGVVSERG